MTEHVDVLIIGAGLSGIGAAVHLQRESPGRSYAILEGRASSGGTWDLFRYPGIRSDSDMYTLGYAFKPWREAKAIADGPSILKYIRETASEHGVERHIRYHHRVLDASWSSEAARWTVRAERGEAREPVTITCGFLLACTGYYNYARGYVPDFEGVGDYRGRIVHPQFWPQDLDYAGRRVVVIGSGATAVTIVPEVARTAAHVTMLQRSPTYVVARPSRDAIADWLRRRLPATLAYGLTRWKNVLLGMYFYRLCKRRPERVKKLIADGVRQMMGKDYDAATEANFTPRYNPWDQRLCLVPDADLFRALRRRQASIVTDTIERFTPDGLKLRSGTALDADIVVMATGLDLLPLGGMSVMVDGRAVKFGDTLSYKGMMFSDVPNFAAVSGYTNASWTLKADLIAAYVCRLLNHMQRHGLRQCTPRNGDPTMATEPWIDFSSGYIQRALHLFPRQGSRKPWKLHQNYARDLLSLKFGSVRDDAMVFSK
ncbi:MAG: NAD(P)/FAD-dependent oxidoreductase [Alphaproteobacteria bacterium]|nr:NAD(P)/FAD-dependent oxidoreductase [Alphaproteobacteria bacterium]MCW5744064.1 NAD(P)/FAD-dependent oxidoreductase [Alphaproteobacteria bacterium]